MAETAQPDDLLARARDAQQRGDIAGALETLERLLAAQPANVEALLYRSTILEELGRIRESEAGYMQIAALAPNNAPALLRLGYLARKQGNRERSLDFFQRAVVVAPVDSLMIASRVQPTMPAAAAPADVAAMNWRRSMAFSLRT